MKCFLKLVLTILFVVVSHQGYAQEFSGKSNVSNEDSNVKPIRIGAKLGFPNLISLNLEYVLPILDNKLAVSADISKINSSSVADIMGFEDDSELDMKFGYFEGGLNYYFFKPGSGLYAGFSYSSSNFEGVIYDYDFYESGTGEDIDGNGYIDFTNGSFNLKVGAKVGGTFYFRPEIGYAFSAFPEEVPIEVRYTDGYKEQQTFETYATDVIHSGLIFNFGFGFAF